MKEEGFRRGDVPSSDPPLMGKVSHQIFFKKSIEIMDTRTGSNNGHLEFIYLFISFAIT